VRKREKKRTTRVRKRSRERDKEIAHFGGQELK
jgi:hypothetical protein